MPRTSPSHTKKLKWFLYRYFERWSISAATAYRRCVTGPVAVAVTGSCGKTTAVNLIGAILARRGNGLVSDGRMTPYPQFAFRVLAMRPWHRHFVQEISGHTQYSVITRTRMMRPKIGVVTNVGLDHYSTHRGRDGVAEAKVNIVEPLPEDGVAVLNADDSYVMAMAGRTRARVITFGVAGDADVRGSGIAAAWPDRLSLTLSYGGESRHVQTQLLGEHWVTSVLAAAAAALAAGATLDDCVAGLAATEPTPGRMCPHELPGGAVIIDDSVKAPHWTMPTAIQFMESARARRKTLVVGTISDYPGTGSSKYRGVARAALSVADEVCFTGRNSRAVRKIAAGEGKGRLFILDGAKDLAEHLSGRLERGDLVVIKASDVDHLERAILQQTIGIACWREKCGRENQCMDCDLRLVPSAPPRGNGVRLDAEITE